MAGLDPAIHVLQRTRCATWMPGSRPLDQLGTGPGMTIVEIGGGRSTVGDAIASRAGHTRNQRARDAGRATEAEALLPGLVEDDDVVGADQIELAARPLVEHIAVEMLGPQQVDPPLER